MVWKELEGFWVVKKKSDKELAKCKLVWGFGGVVFVLEKEGFNPFLSP